jgi:hypothetical protein
VTRAKAEQIVAETAPATTAAGSGDAGGKGPSQATALRGMALERYDFGVGQDGSPYAVAKSGPRIAQPFSGARSALRAELARLYAEHNGGHVPNAGALTDALTALHGHALTADPRPLAIRVGRHGGCLYLDLGRVDGHVVRIAAEGWQVITESPILFRRTALIGPLPDPARGSSLDPLLERLNVNSDDWPLLVGYLVSCLIPDMPHPVLAFNGEQGTGKSTATRLLAMLIDPSPAPLRSAPRDVEQWAVTAQASWLVGLDNVSGIPGWLSDALCRAVTGDGFLRRLLYTDSDVSVIAYRRCVILNGIDYGALRSDLADRMLSVRLERIEPDRRRTAAAVELSDDDRATALGGLLDIAVKVLAELPGVDLGEMPRMADFSRVLAAMDAATGACALKRYAEQAADLASVVVDADPFASAVADLMTRLPDGTWTGTGVELLDLLTAPDPRPRTWPPDGQRANGALRRAAPALRAAAHLHLTERAHPRTRRTTWTISRKDHSHLEPPEEASQPSTDAPTCPAAAKHGPRPSSGTPCHTCTAVPAPGDWGPCARCATVLIHRYGTRACVRDGLCPDCRRGSGGS